MPLISLLMPVPRWVTAVAKFHGEVLQPGHSMYGGGEIEQILPSRLIRVGYNDIEWPWRTGREGSNISGWSP